MNVGATMRQTLSVLRRACFRLLVPSIVALNVLALVGFFARDRWRLAGPPALSSACTHRALCGCPGCGVQEVALPAHPASSACSGPRLSRPWAASG